MSKTASGLLTCGALGTVGVPLLLRDGLRRMVRFAVLNIHGRSVMMSEEWIDVFGGQLRVPKPEAEDADVEREDVPVLW